MKFNASIDVAIIISLITVFLFANGQAYLGGLLSPFGIDPIVLNFSVQDKIYIGYLKGLHYLLYAILALLLIIFLKRLTDFQSFLKHLENSYQKTRKISNQKAQLYNPQCLSRGSIRQRL